MEKNTTKIQTETDRSGKDKHPNPRTPIKYEKEKKKSTKRKTDVFQRVFNSITKIIHELWLERNNDQHNPLQGQQQMAKLNKATRTVEDLYSLHTLIMPQHELTYFAIPMTVMLEQSSSRMLAWANRWKIGIY